VAPVPRFGPGAASVELGIGIRGASSQDSPLPFCSVRRRPAPTVPSRTLVCRYLSAQMPLVSIRADRVVA